MSYTPIDDPPPDVSAEDIMHLAVNLNVACLLLLDFIHNNPQDDEFLHEVTRFYREFLGGNSFDIERKDYPTHIIKMCNDSAISHLKFVLEKSPDGRKVVIKRV
jgi:hypothetical protein